jgi:chaperonin GroEL (HSP60 family)
VVGGSDADCKERRDRVDDAVCAVRGALRSGAYPAGGWALLRLSDILLDRATDPSSGAGAAEKILIKALTEPFMVLLDNAGLGAARFDEIVGALRATLTCDPLEVETAQVWDAAKDKIVVADEVGLLDSAPAVIEAVRTAIATGGQLGTMAGCVVNPRDATFERDEGHRAIDWERHVGIDVNDDHG